jgi:magnesium and cobalt transporter
VCRALGIDKPADVEVSTVGGLLSEALGHIPKPGDTLDWQGYRLTVMAATRRGVDLVRITRID